MTDIYTEQAGNIYTEEGATDRHAKSVVSTGVVAETGLGNNIEAAAMGAQGAYWATKRGAQVQEALKEVAVQAEEDNNAGVRDAIYSMIENGQLTPDFPIEDVISTGQALLNEDSSVDPQLAFFLSIQKVGGLADRQAGMELYASMLISQYMSKQQDKWLDIGGLFVSDTLKDNFDAYVSGGTTIAEDKDNLAKMLGTDKLKVLPKYVEKWYRALDENEIKLAGHIMDVVNFKTGTEERIFAALEAAGGIATLKSLAKAIAIAGKNSGNGIRIAKALKQEEVAAELAIESSKSERVASSVNTTQQGATATILPGDELAKQAFPEVAAQVGAASQKFMQKRVAQERVMRSEFDELDRDQILTHSITPEGEEFLKFEEEAIAKTIAEHQPHTVSIADVKIVDRTASNFKIKYTVKEEVGDVEFKTMEQTVDYPISSEFSPEKFYGSWIGEGIGNLRRLIASPMNFMKKIGDPNPERATTLEFASASLRNHLSSARKIVDQNLPKVGKARKEAEAQLNEIILKGEREGRDYYTKAELESFGMVEEQTQLAYYAMRDFAKNAERIQMADSYRRVLMSGMKELAYTTKKGEQRILGTPEFDKKTVSGKVLVFDKAVGRGRPRNLTKAEKEQLENGQLVFFKLDEGQRIGKGEWTHAVVDPQRLGSPTASRFVGIKGYFPRLHDDLNYVVLAKVKVLRNGVEVTRDKLVKAFDDITDAERWVASNPKIKTKRTETLDKVEVLQARQLSTTQKKNVNEFLLGTSAQKHRSADEVFEFINRVPPMESWSNTIATMARNISFNDYRTQMIKKWENTYGDLTDTGSIFDTISKEKAGVGTRQRNAAEASQEWIKDLIGLPIDSELRWQATMSQLGEWAQKRGDRKLGKHFFNLAHKDPFSAMRAAAFHAYLGMFNPAQWFVQAQNMSVAVSLGLLSTNSSVLKAGTQAIAMQMAHTLHKAKNARAIAKLEQRVMKDAGWKNGELSQIMHEMEQNGLLNSVSSTADYDRAIRGGLWDSGAMGAMKNLSLAFFRGGEGFGRALAYSIARQQYKAERKIGSRALTKDEVTELADITMKKYMLNMSVAARAHWQRGVWGNVLQFRQVQAKFLEMLMGKDLSGTEKLKLLTGQALLYGAVGFPMGEVLLANYRKFAETDTEAESDEQRALRVQVESGLMNSVTSYFMGEGAPDISGRGALFKDISGAITSVLTRDLPSITSIIPVSTVVERGIDSMTALVQIASMPLQPGEIPEQQRLATLSQLTSIFSTVNNAYKARLWHRAGAMMDKRLNRVVNLDDTNSFAVFSQALGLTPQQLIREWDRADSDRADKEAFQGAVTAYKGLLMNYGGSPLNIPAEQLSNFSWREAWIFAGWREDQINRIKESAFRDLLTGEDSKFKRDIDDLADAMMGGPKLRTISLTTGGSK